MAPRRKCPFSGKAKKEQLKEKKIAKQILKRGDKPNIPFLRKGALEDDGGEHPEGFGMIESVRLNQQPTSSSGRGRSRNVNRYALQFYQETREEIEARKKEARASIVQVSKEELEIDIDSYFPSQLDIPKRPPWNFSMTREELDAKENKYFMEYVKKLENEFGMKNLSYFELNLETWRQLWRVLEMADIVLIIVDIRFAALMFPPSVYKFVCEEMKKDMILVLNKIDLAPPDLVVAWKHYFMKHFPTLKIVTFTSFPSYNLRNNVENKSGLQVRRRRGKLRMAAEGAQKLYEACKEITQGAVDLSSWGEKISEEMNNTYDDVEVELNIVNEKLDTGFQEHVKYKGGTLTIGCIGQPNVGKSSLMNAIMGKKVVSVSRTPGHTKHFQTIYLTNNVILCDCPGLVFPSKVPRTLQILIGAYPIAQVREPYTAVKYLAERLNLPKLLAIQHPENDDTWSAIDVCDGWAKKRGFFTAKAARLDSYRAANNILRMALDGKICLCLKPTGYHANQDTWLNHPEVNEITWIQAKHKESQEKDDYEGEGDDSSEEEDDVKRREQKEGEGEEEEEEEEEEETESDENDIVGEGGDTTKRTFANRFELLQGEDD